MNKYLPYIVVFILSAIIGWWSCREYHFRDTTKKVETQVVVKYDTIKIEKPQEIRYKTIEKVIKVPIIDTIRINDTIYLQLPKEVKEYKANEYYAKVSGYKPSLDYIEVYPKTTIITETITQQKKDKKHSVGIGIEARYSKGVFFPVQAEYSYKVMPWLSVYGYGEYEIKRKQFGVGLGTRININW